MLSLTPKHLILKVKCAPDQVNPPFFRLSCAIVHALFDNLEFRYNFSQIFRGHRLRPFLWRQLALTAKPSHFKGQICLRAGKPQFCRLTCAIVHGLFGDLKFRYNFYKKFSWTTVKTLAMKSVRPHVQNIPY